MFVELTKGTYAANWNLLPELEKYDIFTFEHKDINDIRKNLRLRLLYQYCGRKPRRQQSIESSTCFVHSNINGVHHILKLINQKKGSPTCSITF
jgi:dTDP-D-glucose 4,6-dehydratase